MSNENELKAVNENNSLDSAADILYLNADNSVFVESEDFVGLRLSESAAAHLGRKGGGGFYRSGGKSTRSG